jgi:MFS family permease
MQLSKAGEFTLLLAATHTIMVGAALAPGLESIADALGVSRYAPLLITLPALGAVLFAPLFGLWIDRLGARKVLLMSLLGYFVLGAGGAVLHGPVVVAIDRILLGGFAAGIMASGTAEISQWYTGKARLGMIAKQGMSIELGGVIFLLIGGLLGERTWQGPFALYFLGAICFVMVLLFIPKRKSINSHDDHVIPKETATIRPILICTFFAMSLFFSMIVTLPGLMTQRLFSESQIGYLLSFISLVAVMAAMVMPKVIAKTSERTTLILAFVCYAIALFLFASNTITAMLVLAAVFAGSGFGLSIPLLNHSTVENSTEQNRGYNLSLFAIAVFSGQFATSILDFLPLPHHMTLLVCAAIAILCALILCFKQRRNVKLNGSLTGGV